MLTIDHGSKVLLRVRHPWFSKSLVSETKHRPFASIEASLDGGTLAWAAPDRSQPPKGGFLMQH